MDNVAFGWTSKILNKGSDDGFKKLLSDEKQRVNSSETNQEIQTTNITTGNPPSPEGYGRTGNLQIQSNKDLNLTSTNLKSENGDITLTSNQNINITAAQAINTSNRDEDGKTDHKKLSTEIAVSEGRSTSSSLEADNITIASNNPPSPEGYGRTGNITLQAAKLKAEESVNVDAENNLLITTAQDFSTSSETNKSKTTYSKSIGNSGAINSAITNTEIYVPDPIKLKLDAGNLIYAEYSSTSAKATGGQANPNLSQIPRPKKSNLQPTHRNPHRLRSNQS